MRQRLVLASVIVFAGAVLAAGGDATVSPVLTVASVVGSVDAVAQDGSRVAWLSGNGRADGGCDELTIEDLSTRARTIVIQANARIADGAACAAADNARDLALAGTQALWSSWSHGNNEYLTLWFGSASRPAGRAILYSARGGLDSGAHYRGLAGSAPTLAYAVTNWESTSKCARYEQNGGWCPAIRRPSPVRRLDERGRAHDVPRSDAGDGIAASGGLVATVRKRRITVADARTGARVGSAVISSCSPVSCDSGEGSTPVALGRTMVAVVSGFAIEVHDWRTHRLVRRVRLASLPTNIALSGNLLVWGTSSRYACRVRDWCPTRPTSPCARICAVWVLDLATGRPRVVARPELDPFDVTISGRRIVWGENEFVVKDHEVRPVRGHVRMLELP